MSHTRPIRYRLLGALVLVSALFATFGANWAWSRTLPNHERPWSVSHPASRSVGHPATRGVRHPASRSVRHRIDSVRLGRVAPAL